MSELDDHDETPLAENRLNASGDATEPVAYVSNDDGPSASGDPEVEILAVFESQPPLSDEGSAFADSDIHPSRARPRKLSGPGLFESVLWMLGMLAVQLGATVGTIVVFIIHRILTSGTLTTPEVESLVKANFTVIMGCAQVATVVYCMLAVMLRLAPRGLSRLGLQAPSFLHLSLVALATIPLSLLCTPLQSWVMEYMPKSDGGLMELLESMSSSPVEVLLLVIAVAPALGEELMFRGLIGRGLIARWGTVGGVLITSILFGIVHLNPAQGLAVIPLGIAMHFVYLMTKSFWAPVLLHFLNNSFAVVMLKYGSKITPEGLAGDDIPIPWPLLLAAGALVMTFSVLFWLTRVRTPPTGSALTATPCPEPLSPLTQVTQSAPPYLLACGVFNMAGFVAAIARLA